jgi:hypothetical protein
MKRPSLQFYPADWRNNAKLRFCSFRERGIWLELMCILHDSDEYGVTRRPLKDLAQAIGCRVADLRALVTNKVLKGADAGERCKPFIYVPRHARQEGKPVTLITEQAGPLWFSSRMITDEYIRSCRGQETRFEPRGEDSGDSPDPSPNHPQGEDLGDSPDHSPNPPPGDGPTTTSSSSLNDLSTANAVLVDSAAADSLGDCPHQEIIALYAKHLPELTQPRIWDGARAETMRSRWKKLAKVNGVSKGYRTTAEGLKFWERYFAYVANSTMLPDGFKRDDGTFWKPDLPWLIKAENFNKVIEGNYARE